MTAYVSMAHHHSGCCGVSAATGTSAHICRLLDTAILAVSVFIVRLALVLGLALEKIVR